MSAYLRLISYFKPYKGKILLSFLMIIIFSATNIAIIPLMREFTKSLSTFNISLFKSQLFLLSLLILIRTSARYCHQYITAAICNHTILTIRQNLYDKLLTLSLQTFNSWKQGDTISRVFSDGEKIREALSIGLRELLPSLITFFGVLFWLFYLNTKLTLVILIDIPIIIFCYKYFGQKLQKTSHSLQQRIANLMHHFHESITNISIIKIFTLEKTQSSISLTENKASFSYIMKLVRYQVTFMPILDLINFLSIVFIFGLAGFDLLNGHITGPELIGYFTGLVMLGEPLVKLSEINSVTAQSLASANRIFEILDEPVEIPNNIAATSSQKIIGNIEFKNISFTYKDSPEKVLDNITLSIKKNQTIAIVGGSGAGKTTLVNLLPRLYEITKGQLLFNGIDVTTIHPTFLRQHIGMVTQHSYLFRGTLYDNIQYGDLDASEEDIKNAAEKANAAEFIEKLPLKYQSLLGDQGVNLSGGQRQRLAIARAILKNPAILILDEATSSLDSHSEKLVQKALLSLMKDRTTLVIAHRLSTILHADTIIVLEKGKIVESGTHKDLLSKNGAYKRLYQTQIYPDA